MGKAGKKRSVYVSSINETLLSSMQASQHISVSEIIASGIRNKYMETFSKVRISEGAYLCMAMSRLDLLQCVHLEDGYTLVTLKDGVLCDAEGNLTDIGKRRQKLMDIFLGIDADTAGDV